MRGRKRLRKKTRVRRIIAQIGRDLLRLCNTKYAPQPVKVGDVQRLIRTWYPPEISVETWVDPAQPNAVQISFGGTPEALIAAGLVGSVEWEPRDA